MSKGDSHLFSGTSNNLKALIAEVIDSGEKISPENVLMITREPGGKIIWMETGNNKAGLMHIVTRHGSQFSEKGISNDDIPNYVLEAVYQGNIVGIQGKRNPRIIYEFTYHGVRQRVAVQVGDNGYIVSANPKSMKEARS